MVRRAPIFGLCILITLIVTAARSDDRERIAPANSPYPTDHQAPLDATQELASDAELYQLWRVEFNGIKMDRVPAFLYVPKHRAGKSPGVLLQYGIGGDKKVDYIVALAKQFVARGFIVLTIDAPGRGERKVPQTQKRNALELIFGNEGRELFLQYCGDYSRSVDYLVSRTDVDPERIGYVGISWGAITGVTYAAHDRRVKAIGSMVGGGNFLGISGFSADKPSDDTKAKPIPVDPVFHVSLIAPRPLLLLNVTNDQLIARPFAEALHNAAGEGAHKVWIETDHYFNGVDRHQVGESVIDFMEARLSPK